jgi:hypothetical protein
MEPRHNKQLQLIKALLKKRGAKGCKPAALNENISI